MQLGLGVKIKVEIQPGKGQGGFKKGMQGQLEI